MISNKKNRNDENKIYNNDDFELDLVSNILENIN